ncbi:MAG TPA: hypothetical protein VKR58_11495 [Aquella sp.]|nr:hypothetical protein [Aquella sp.]
MKKILMLTLIGSFAYANAQMCPTKNGASAYEVDEFTHSIICLYEDSNLDEKFEGMKHHNNDWSNWETNDPDAKATCAPNGNINKCIFY